MVFYTFMKKKNKTKRTEMMDDAGDEQMRLRYESNSSR